MRHSWISTRRRRLRAAAAACALVPLGALGACAGEDDPAGAPPATSVPGATGSSTPPADLETTPSAPTGTSVDPGQPTTSIAPSEVSTADRSEAPPAEVIEVIGVDVASDGETDQLVITTSGGTPGWSLRYVDAVRIDGEPVLVEGAAALELVLESADPGGDQGIPAEVAVEVLPDLPLLREVRFAYYLGDQLTYAVGLSERAPFNVSVQPDEIVITFTR